MRYHSKDRLVKPFLKWAGGKRQLVSQLLNQMPKTYGTYYEPFLGGGALLLELQPETAVVNDRNSELTNCYRVVRDSLDELIEALKLHQDKEEYYYQVRDWDRSREYCDLTPVQRAARIIFLNKTCYNGLFRVNSQGQFNVPFGRYKQPTIVNKLVLSAVSHYLTCANVEILSLDFAAAVRSAIAGDFIYFDPPYDPVSSTASFTGYDVNGFDRREQIRLKEVVDDLTQRGCKVLLSNACTEFILNLYKEYTIVTVSATRSINSKANRRGKVDEVLVMNYSPSEAIE